MQGADSLDIMQSDAATSAPWNVLACSIVSVLFSLELVPHAVEMASSSWQTGPQQGHGAAAAATAAAPAQEAQAATTLRLQLTKGQLHLAVALTHLGQAWEALEEASSSLQPTDQFHEQLNRWGTCAGRTPVEVKVTSDEMQARH